METQIYALTGRGLKPLTSDGKDNLAIGTWLKLYGYNHPKHVITKKLESGNYLCVNPENLAQGQYRPYELEFITDKKDQRIQTYILDTPPMEAEAVKELLANSEVKLKEQREAKEQAQQEHNAIIEKGRQIMQEKKPAWAKATIIGYKEIDDCDIMTDYFSTKSGSVHVLAWSKHTRDIFPEMRKAAANLEQTKHLATAPTVDTNNEPKTDRNKGWWHPRDEHREKYSMGSGYYLKDALTYSTGWKVEKRSGHNMDEIAFAIGSGRYHVPKTAQKQEKAAEPVGEIAITKNEEENGIEIAFPGKPEKSVLTALKSHGFRWHKKLKFWYAKQSPERLEFAENLRG